MIRKAPPSKYQAMWLVVMFDLPMHDLHARRRYTQFRKMLLSDGFARLQLSVYDRYCSGEEIANRIRRIIEQQVPPEGQVRVIAFTDDQFVTMQIFEGKTRVKPENAPMQYVLF